MLDFFFCAALLQFCRRKKVPAKKKTTNISFNEIHLRFYLPFVVAVPRGYVAFYISVERQLCLERHHQKASRGERSGRGKKKIANINGLRERREIPIHMIVSQLNLPRGIVRLS